MEAAAILAIVNVIAGIIANAQSQGRGLTADEAATIQQNLAAASAHTAGVLQAWQAAGPQ